MFENKLSMTYEGPTVSVSNTTFNNFQNSGLFMIKLVYNFQSTINQEMVSFFESSLF